MNLVFKQPGVEISTLFFPRSFQEVEEHKWFGLDKAAVWCRICLPILFNHKDFCLGRVLCHIDHFQYRNFAHISCCFHNLSDRIQFECSLVRNYPLNDDLMYRILHLYDRYSD